MVPGVDPDGVSGGDEGASDLGLLLDEAAEQKECRLDAVALEDLHHAPGVRIVGAVVIGEGKQARAARQADEGRAVDLRSRPHGLKARPCGESGDTGGAEKDRKHKMIVAWTRLFALRFSPLALRRI